ncbi:MAG: hypothetical protein JW860_11185 [Sedimentisphaerales bacterium]|nr:hypothetical protein [Sedimentisphaerales bacterium]
METFIVFCGLAAAAGGSLILLTCLAGKRTLLIKKHNYEIEMQELQKKLSESRELEQMTAKPHKKVSAKPEIAGLASAASE